MASDNMSRAMVVGITTISLTLFNIIMSIWLSYVGIL
jgi:hypothetical protein